MGGGWKPSTGATARPDAVEKRMDKGVPAGAVLKSRPDAEGLVLHTVAIRSGQRLPACDPQN